MKKGKSLEQLVEYLEKLLIDDEDVIITSPYKIPDRVTQKPREFDVVIQTKIGHHKSLIAFECRDRSRKVTVNEVESFWKKCEDTGVKNRVIVSQKGFFKTALIKAAFENIRCLELTKVKSLSEKSQFELSNEIIKIQKKVLEIKINWIAEENINPILKEYDVISSANTPFTNETLQEMIQGKWNEFSKNLEKTGIQNTKFIFDISQLYLIDRETNEKIKLKELHANIKFEISKISQSIEFFDYLDRFSGETITNIGLIENNKMNNINHTLLFTQTNNTLTLTFIPQEK